MPQIPNVMPEPGVVYLHDWLRGTDGRNYICVAGMIKVKKDELLLGFKTRGGHNWGVEITGPSGRRVYIMGCQVKAVYLGIETLEHAETVDTWIVP